MCGIYGYISFKERVDSHILRSMGDALKHRGPDDEGEYIHHSEELSVGLGHKRLAIIDLSPAGKQPMANEDDNIWISFNGEIYNFRELRKESEAKEHRFRSNSDTEAVVHLYEEVGIHCLQKLNGMFAFALWDKTKKALYLVRDRMGEKPLHYCFYDGGLVFASEIKSLLRHPKVPKVLDLASLGKYLSYEYVPAPNTIFKAIKKLEPGHCLFYRDGKAQSFQYWDIPLVDHPLVYRTESECVEELRERLDRSVRSKLVADVPVGVFLSGGIDSGLVAAYATKANQQLECITMGFDNPSFDESRYAKIVAQALGVKHQLRVFSMQEMLEGLLSLPDMLDEPLADASILPTYLLSKFTSERVKVALSGDGGDELFAGYQTYQAHRLVTYYDSLPGFLKNALKALALYLPVSHDNLSKDFKIKQFLKGVGVSSEIRFFIWQGAFIESEKGELLTDELKVALRDHNTYEDLFRYIARSNLTKDLERILYLSMKLYLQDDILIKTDRASMANSLEVRAPLLDHGLVEFVCRLPMLYKLNGLKTKYLFKKAAMGILPESIIHRQKKGFGIPLSRWLSKELKDFMLDYLSEERIKRQGFFNYLYVKKLIDDHIGKKRDNRKLLWPLIAFQIWHERFIERAR